MNNSKDMINDIHMRIFLITNNFKEHIRKAELIKKYGEKRAFQVTPGLNQPGMILKKDTLEYIRLSINKLKSLSEHLNSMTKRIKNHEINEEEAVIYLESMQDELDKIERDAGKEIQNFRLKEEKKEFRLGALIVGGVGLLILTGFIVIVVLIIYLLNRWIL